MKKIIGCLALIHLSVSIAFGQAPSAFITSSLAELKSKYQLSQSDIDEVLVTNQYTDKRTGITHVYVKQLVNGIPVFNANSSLHFNKQGQLIHHNNGFIPNAKFAVNVQKPVIGASTALMAAGVEAEMNLAAAMSKADKILAPDELLTINEKTISSEPIKVKLFYHYQNKQLLLAYNVEVYNKESNDWWNIRIDATTGVFLDKNNWTAHCEVENGMFTNWGSESVESIVSVKQSNKYNKKMTIALDGKYNIYPFPIESPNHGSRQMIESMATPNASPYGWHDTDGVAGAEFTVTRGNNVSAEEDTLATNGNGYSPNGGDSLVFDFPMDTTWMNPNTYLNASITQLFYANNYLHDVFYNYGFDEEAGNYQLNNYGKGGIGRDWVQADAMDGSGTGNANFSAPVDGISGRMQMYLWPISSGGSTTNNLTIQQPSSIAGVVQSPISQFGSKRFAEIINNVVVGRDVSSADSLGCGALVNTAEVAGKIVLLYRGTCGFTNKVLNAQNAGAIAVIVINNNSQNPTSMTGSSASITIPSVMISRADGVKIKGRIDAGDTVTVRLTGQALVKAYDSDFDNGVIAHEFGHGISIRLTGGPANSSCLNNAEQAGEGWSDFFALALTAKPSDSTAAKGIGTFVFNQNPSGLGIRSFKYSRDMSINPMTYNYVSDNRGVHYVGTVWCTMLNDIFWDMVDKYGFDEDILNGTGGNNKTIQLVMEGLKLQPCSPGFVDSRDAILLADSILFNGANQKLLWKAFARRGLGVSADQGSSQNVSDGTEAFDIPLFTSVNEQVNLAQYIQLSPNPSEGSFYIVMPDQLQKANLTVTDIAGKVVFEKTIETQTNQRAYVDMSGSVNGVYFVTLTQGNTVFQSKLLIAK